MHWTCTPFQPSDPHGKDCDAAMSLRPAVRSHHRITIIKPFDRTDLSMGRTQAHVLAKSRHPGVTKMRLSVGMANHFCPAGQYCTTVNLTVSAL